MHCCADTRPMSEPARSVAGIRMASQPCRGVRGCIDSLWATDLEQKE